MITILNSTGILQYDHIDPNCKFNENSYLLAVFVNKFEAKENRYVKAVVPVIPNDAPLNIFPLHLRGDVKKYFDNKYPEITGTIMVF